MRDLFQVVFELKQKEIDDAYKKMDKDKRVKIDLHIYKYFFSAVIRGFYTVLQPQIEGFPIIFHFSCAVK